MVISILFGRWVWVYRIFSELVIWECIRVFLFIVKVLVLVSSFLGSWVLLIFCNKFVIFSLSSFCLC